MGYAYSLHLKISMIDLAKHEVEGILTDSLDTLEGVKTQLIVSPEFIRQLQQKLSITPFKNTLPENMVYYLTGLNKDPDSSGSNYYLTIYYKKLRDIQNNKNSYHREKIELDRNDAKEFERKTTIII